MIYFLVNLILSIQLGIIFYQIFLFALHLRKHQSISDINAFSKRSFTIFFSYLFLLTLLLFLLSLNELEEVFYFLGFIGIIHSIIGLLLIPVMSFFSNRAMNKAFAISHMISIYVTIYLGISSMVGIYQFTLNA
jgi:hypothetical protein